jgi:hypothetical protein
MTTPSVEQATRWARIRAKVTYANAMATIAVFLALGGVGYAATDNLRDLNREQGRHLWSGRTYSVTTQTRTSLDGRFSHLGAYCDEFDPAIGGGFDATENVARNILVSKPDKADGEDPGITVGGWILAWANVAGSQPITVSVKVRCADFLNLHQGG